MLSISLFLFFDIRDNAEYIYTRKNVTENSSHSFSKLNNVCLLVLLQINYCFQDFTMCNFLFIGSVKSHLCPNAFILYWLLSAFFSQKAMFLSHRLYIFIVILGYSNFNTEYGQVLEKLYLNHSLFIFTLAEVRCIESIVSIRFCVPELINGVLCKESGGRKRGI